MPKCISEYNSSMGGVNVLDKQVSHYRTRIRGKKWWFPVFTQFLDITVVNAWRVYQESSGDKAMLLLTARKKITLSYLSKPSPSSRKRPGPRRKKVLDGRVSKAIRLDEGNHLVQPVSTQRRCANCGKEQCVFVLVARFLFMKNVSNLFIQNEVLFQCRKKYHLQVYVLVLNNLFNYM